MAQCDAMMQAIDEDTEMSQANKTKYTLELKAVENKLTDGYNVRGYKINISSHIHKLINIRYCWFMCVSNYDRH
jgi:hypothetical protein